MFAHVSLPSPIISTQFGNIDSWLAVASSMQAAAIGFGPQVAHHPHPHAHHSPTSPFPMFSPSLYPYSNYLPSLNNHHLSRPTKDTTSQSSKGKENCRTEVQPLSAINESKQCLNGAKKLFKSLQYFSPSTSPLNLSLTSAINDQVASIQRNYYQAPLQSISNSNKSATQEPMISSITNEQFPIKQNNNSSKVLARTNCPLTIPTLNDECENNEEEISQNDDNDENGNKEETAAKQIAIELMIKNEEK